MIKLKDIVSIDIFIEQVKNNNLDAKIASIPSVRDNLQSQISNMLKLLFIFSISVIKKFLRSNIMSKKITFLSNLIPLIMSLLIIGAVLIWAPVCDGMLELASGNEVHMKCFYTSQASIIVAIILFVISAKNLFLKRNEIIAYLAIGILLFLLPITSPIGIGVCVKETMSCQTTAVWLKVIGAVVALSGFLTIFSKSEHDV